MTDKDQEQDSMSLLQHKLKEKMSETGISAHALEMQAGLKRSAVQNILYGRSRKPSAEIIHAISKILDCSVADLLGNAKNHTTKINPPPAVTTSVSTPLNTQLYAEAVQTAAEIFIKLAVTPNKPQALNYIDEVYQYALESKSNAIDKRFAEWLASKWFIVT